MSVPCPGIRPGCCRRGRSAGIPTIQSRSSPAPQASPETSPSPGGACREDRDRPWALKSQPVITQAWGLGAFTVVVPHSTVPPTNRLCRI